MFDLDSFVADCHDALAEARPVLAVRELVERAVAHPSELKAVLGEPTVGGYVPLHRGPSLTVLFFVWPPSVSLYPHDHRMWAANGIFAGGEDNVFYRRTDEGIVRSGAAELRIGDAVALGREAVHAVTNPFRTYAAAIHVYGGDFIAASRSQWSSSTAEEESFDAEALRGLLRAADQHAGTSSRPPR